MKVVDLSSANRGMIELVGGKAAGLGEMIGAGERVPPGFVVTTEAYRSGEVPEEELLEAYGRLGGGPVAVRSSATAEDLPEASFAGQQDTYLGVEGPERLVEAVRECWGSLHTERAIAYRQANDIDESAISMAVVVQRMVDAEVAGVLFTADPLTGSRSEMVVDAAPGLGTSVVEGSVNADHYVIGEEPPDQGGCLDRPRLRELAEAGRRLQEHFGRPQDAEWAYDSGGTLWLLQSRAITTLFPLPPRRLPEPRVYFEFGHMEGLLRPITPMGGAAFRAAVAYVAGGFGVKIDPLDGPKSLVVIGGRLYADLTPLVRDKSVRKRIPDGLMVYGPRAAPALRRLLDDPRFAPVRGRSYRMSTVLRSTVRLLPMYASMMRALINPAAAREWAFRLPELARRQSAPRRELTTAADRIRHAAEVQRPLLSKGMLRFGAPLTAGMMSVRLAGTLLKGITEPGEVDEVFRGMPYNITTEMDLELWALASRAGEHRELLLNTPPQELAARFLRGTLPDIGLRGFLDQYGRRGTAEADMGMPRWSEDPAPLFSMIANYLRVTDPAQAPDRRFAAAAREAEAKLEELVRRARGRRRFVRAALAGFFMRRGRALAGLREIGKFSWLYPLAEMRGQLLAAGEELAGRGALERADDIMFLDLREALAVAEGREQATVRDRVAERRAEYARELRRRHVPGLLLSDGTDLEVVRSREAAKEGALSGMGAAPGVATGPARVILDPAGAHVEPGEILVAPTTDPAWTPLFMTAAGLVTETGSPMAHGPTVAREYGIPAVVGVPHATREIKPGQVITVDGSSGTITAGT